MRDAVGERLHLSNSFRRDGVRLLVLIPNMCFNINVTSCRLFSTLIKPKHSSGYSDLIHALHLTLKLRRDWQTQRHVAAHEVVAQSRRSRGLFAWLRNGIQARSFPPTYNYRPDGSACRVYGSVEVKKVTGVWSYFFALLFNRLIRTRQLQANLHITTLGHGYAGHEHTDHSCKCRLLASSTQR